MALCPIVVTDKLMEMAEQTAKSFTNPMDQGLPMLALIQDFVLAKFCPFWGHLSFLQSHKLMGYSNLNCVLA